MPFGTRIKFYPKPKDGRIQSPVTKEVGSNRTARDWQDMAARAHAVNQHTSDPQEDSSRNLTEEERDRDTAARLWEEFYHFSSDGVTTGRMSSRNPPVSNNPFRGGIQRHNEDHFSEIYEAEAAELKKNKPRKGDIPSLKKGNVRRILRGSEDE